MCSIIVLVEYWEWIAKVRKPSKYMLALYSYPDYDAQGPYLTSSFVQK